MSLLLITLPTAHATDARYDYVLSGNGRTVLSHGRCTATQLPQGQHEVVEVIPARMLSWHRVQLPAGILSTRIGSQSLSPRIRAVIEGLLEDELLDEPGHLHFSLQPNPHSDAPIWIAACDKNWLRTSLQSLQSAGHTAHRIVPEWSPRALASASEGTSSRVPTLWAVGRPDSGRLIWADDTGVHVLPISQAHGIPAHSHEIGPPHARLRAEPAIAELAEQLLHREATVVPPSRRLLTSAATRWNLAQGDLARRNPLWQRWRLAFNHFQREPQWQPARWAILIILITQIIGINAWSWRMQAQLDKKRMDMRKILIQTFPETPLIVEPRRQMERAVTTLRMASGDISESDLEPMLSAWGAYNTQHPDTPAPTTLDFAPGTLRLKGTRVQHDLNLGHWSSRMENDTLVITPRSLP